MMGARGVGSAVLGVDLGGTSIRAAAKLPDGSRTPVATGPAPASYEQLLDAIAGFAALALPAAVSVIAVGLPGAASAGIAHWVPALSWLDGRPLAADVAQRVGAQRAVLANDAQLALLGEVREGAARHCTNAVLVSVGTGVGGAVMLGGRVVRGAHGTAGAFGWLPSAGFQATADHGPLEQAASGTALDRLAGPGRSGPDLVAAAHRGDPGARATLDRWAGSLGTGMAALASIIDPERVVLSGGLCTAFEVYAEPLRAAMRRAASPHGRDVPVVPAVLGDHAGVVGALYAAGCEEVWS